MAHLLLGRSGSQPLLTQPGGFVSLALADRAPLILPAHYRLTSFTVLV